ncbi:26S proteasome non-ATPase regulatory subunit 2-like [Anneissia japonica]|uniref:26S proteasome non-ATPase regulatory subunit 2-like n=1 Tax=Anneissia japonica TaxID=1529436 RepID=UPI00142551DC|nr:26S proteasome non-ATPase regulatory subunit 2-like [Anneissia japonica]
MANTKNDENKSDQKTEKKHEIDQEPELSEEDKQLQDELNMLVERLTESDTTLYKPALEQLRALIRASTSSMTSVPKPLKFLRPHYSTLISVYEKIIVPENKKFCADIISVLGMTMSDTRDCLKFRLLGSKEEIGSWGHEYVRYLAGEIGQAWNELEDEKKSNEHREKLLNLTNEIIPYHMNHNAEAEACDLLMEIDRLDMLESFVDKDAFSRVCLYLTSCVNYVPEPEDSALLHTALGIFRKFDRYPEALRLAIRLNDMKLIEEIFTTCKDGLLEGSSFGQTTTQVDSARQNLSSSFVNGFVNAGFGQDKLITKDGNSWIYKNKEHGMMSTTASLGLILLWDVDGGLTQIDKYLYSSEDYIKSGALLACGIVNSGVRNECDPARALLSDYVLHNNNTMRIGAIFGLGLAYAGSNSEEVLGCLLPVMADSKSNMEVIGVTAVACGMIAVGSCNGDVTSTILQTMMEKSKQQLKDNYARFLALGLGLAYLGKQESVDATLAALDVIPEPFKQFSKILVEVCAYAGTGNVLKVQQLLHICSEHIEAEKTKEKEKKEKDKKSDDTTSELAAHQGVAVLGIALIAMGEEIGGQMALRSLGHLLRYGEPVIRRAVPLALALISVSNPELQILDTLSKFSHDTDQEVSHNAIFAMGIVGAGTNNARLAAMLRQLAQFHAKDPNNLFMVRIAQGLTHLGKGTLTMSPYHSDRQLLSQVATAGLLVTITSALDVKNTILGKSSYLLYGLVSAMKPRMLVTFDKDLQPLPVPVRVGQAVDVVGQAGRPKTITGFQTHTTPVLLAQGERAELATEEYIPYTPIVEGFVILKKNENYEE